MRLYFTFVLLLPYLGSLGQTIINAYAKVNSIASGNVLSVNNVNTSGHSFIPVKK